MKSSTKQFFARTFAFGAAATACARLLDPVTEHAAPIALAAMIATTVGSFCGGRRGILDRVKFGKFEVPDELIDKMATCGACRHWRQQDEVQVGNLPAIPVAECKAHGRTIVTSEDWNAANCEHYNPRDD